MKKTELPKLDLFVYEETLSNGLRVFVVPNENAKGVFVTFTTKYGGGIDEFIPRGQTKYVKVPHGIAHFLEHKMFEQEDGVDPMKFFSERGADSNANTNSKKTTYLFSGSKCFEENMNYLLDFVESPYFTDENVEKEKGIITQEAKMYLDHPARRMYQESYMQLLVRDSNRYSTIGTIEEINSITKEQLMMCYHTFYHPSNMFVVVSGNVNPETVIQIIKENQEKKHFLPPEPIKIKKKKEPKTLSKKKINLSMNVVIPKISYNLKIDISSLKELEKVLPYYVNIICEVHFSDVSLLQEKLWKEKIITDNLDSMFVIEGDYLLIGISADTKYPTRFLKLVKEEWKDLRITKEEFIRYQRIMISGLLKNSDDIYAMNHKIVNEVIKYDTFIPDPISVIRSLNFSDLEKVLNVLKNYEAGTITIYPKEESK